MGTLDAIHCGTFGLGAQQQMISARPFVGVFWSIVKPDALARLTKNGSRFILSLVHSSCYIIHPKRCEVSSAAPQRLWVGRAMRWRLKLWLRAWRS